MLLSYFHTTLFSCFVVVLIVFTCADYVQPRVVGLCVSLLPCFVLVSLNWLVELEIFEIFQLFFGSLESPFGFFHIHNLTRGISTVCSTLCVFTLFINATFILVYK